MTNNTFYITEGDINPPIIATLVDENETVIDLTNAASVKFFMREPNLGTLKVNGAAGSILTPPTDGRVRYQWVLADTDTSEDYDACFEVLWNDGSKTTFPNYRYIRVKVKKQLG